MARVMVPAATPLGSVTWPHIEYHGALTEVRYAHPEGDNADDGLTWGTAKKDVVSAHDALPNEGGTIFAGDETYWDSVNTDRGLWIVGPNDPAYASPPTGWRRQKRLNLQGIGNSNGQFGFTPQAWIFGGSGTDKSKPALWLSGTDTPHTFENLYTAYPAVNVRLGISTDQTAATNTAGIIFRNFVNDLNQIANNGPGYEIGYAFWVYWDHCSPHGNGYRFPITACSIVSGTTARFTVGTHSFKVGDTVDVAGVTPAGYNGYWTITAVGATTFDADIGSSPAAGSSFGEAEPVLNYRRAAIAYDGNDYFPTAPNSGLWELKNCVFAGGGVVYSPNGNTSGGGIIMTDIVHEGDFVGPEPPAFHLRGPNRGNISGYVGGIVLTNVAHADATSPEGAALVDGLLTLPDTVLAINTDVRGNGATRIGTNSGLSLTSHMGRTQPGIADGTFVGPTVSAERAFGPIPILGTNLVNSDPSTWTVGFGAGGTITTGKTAPDMSTNAASLTGATSPFNEAQLYRAGGYNTAVGDWVIAGCWRRFVSGPYDPSNGQTFPQITLVGGGPPFPQFDLGTFGDSFAPVRNGTYQQDGGWDWVWVARRIRTAGASASELIFSIISPQNGNIEYAYPVMFYVPASAGLSEAQILDVARYMRSFPSGAAATAGNEGIMPNKKLVFAPDTNLYRSAANTLKTDDLLTVQPPATGSEHDLLVMNDGAGRILKFTGETDHFRLRAGSASMFRFKDDGQVALESSMWLNGSYLDPTNPDGPRFIADLASHIPVRFQGITSQTADLSQWLDVGANKLLAVAADGKVLFGNAQDTNLYRSAANMLTTDDDFTLGVVSPVALTTGAAPTRLIIGGALGSQQLMPTGNNAYDIGVDNAGYWRDAFLAGVLKFGVGGSAADTNLYREGADILATDDKLHIVGETEIDGALNHDGTTAGFFGTAPTTKPTALTAAATDTVDTTYGTEESTVINNLRTRVNELESKLQSLGLLS